MNALFTILTILILLASALLVLVVLLQNGKGEGLASNFIAGNQTFGVRQTADLLEKVSWGLVVATQSQPEFPTAPIQQEAPTAPTE